MKVINQAGVVIDWLFKHKTMHEDSGLDEIDVTGLSGKTAELTIHETVTKASTGFPNRTDSVLSFAGTTLSMAPSNGSFDYYINGIKYTKSAQEDIVIASTSGFHAVYYDGSTLSQIANPSESQFDSILVNNAIVATLYWNQTNTTLYLVADERHGAVMSGETHHWLHDNIGANWKSGLTASGYTLSTKSDAALQFDVSDGKFYDEDLEIDISDSKFGGFTT